jgi:hypothetical protein
MKMLMRVAFIVALCMATSSAQEPQYNHVVKVTSTLVYLDGGQRAGINTNDRFVIVRPEPRGSGFTLIAEVMVLRTFEKLAIAEIKSICKGQDIEVLDFAVAENEWQRFGKETGDKIERSIIAKPEKDSTTRRESADRPVKGKGPSLKNRLDVSTKFGIQTYFNDLEPDPGSAGLIGLYIGYKVSRRSMIGLSYATAGYEIEYGDGSTDKTNVGTLLLSYRYSFRVEKPTQPFIEIGFGLADPIIGYDTGTKGAFTFAWGLKRVFKEKWAWSIESRGIYWSQDDTWQVEGDKVTVASNEFSIGISRMFR